MHMILDSHFMEQGIGKEELHHISEDSQSNLETKGLESLDILAHPSTTLHILTHHLHQGCQLMPRREILSWKISAKCPSFYKRCSTIKVFSATFFFDRVRQFATLVSSSSSRHQEQEYLFRSQFHALCYSMKLNQGINIFLNEVPFPHSGVIATPRFHFVDTVVILAQIKLYVSRCGNSFGFWGLA